MQRFVQHGQLCTEDGKEWEVPTSGRLRVNFIQEPSSDRTLGEVGTTVLLSSRASPMCRVVCSEVTEELNFTISLIQDSHMTLISECLRSTLLPLFLGVEVNPLAGSA